MLRQIRWLFFIIILIIASMICGLSITRKSRLISLSKQLPERDIAFWKDINILGFINPDGSGLETRGVSVTGGLIADLKNWNIPPTINNTVNWSLDGNYLAIRYTYQNLGGGFPLIFSKNGKVFQCPYDEDRLFGPGRIWIINDNRIITTVHSFPGYYRIVTLDMFTCKEINQLYAVKIVDANIMDFSYSNKNWMAINLATNDGTKIMVLNEKLQEVFEIPLGYDPSWSIDGKMLAYAIEDGLYVVDQTRKNVQKLINGKYYYPSWSPDGQWLAYYDYDKGTIYKINIKTKEIVELFSGAREISWK